MSEGLLSSDLIDQLISDTPKEIVSYQQGYAQAKEDGTVDAFLSNNKDYRHQQKGHE